MTHVMFGAARIALCVVCACASPPSPSVVTPAPPPPPPMDAAAPDAGPSPELARAPAWIFRYNAPPRVETWALRYVDGEAIVTVETAQTTTTYVGTAIEGATLALSVATATAKVTLDCKHAKRGIGDTCTARKPASLDVLDCFVPGFASPMTFALAPGVEYAASCNGYQRLPPADKGGPG